MCIIVILELRIYALFGRRKWVVWFFVLLTIAELASTLHFFNGPDADPIREALIPYQIGVSHSD